MANLWLRIRIWTKVGVIGLLVLYVIVFTYKNAQEKVELWYWINQKPQTNLLLLVLCSFLAGVIGTLIARATLSTVRQVQGLQDRARSQRLDRDMADIRTKAAMLQTRGVAEPAPSASPPSLKPAKVPPPPIEQLENRTQM